MTFYRFQGSNSTSNCIYFRCTLCEIPYDFIGRTETISEDVAHIIAENGLQRYFEDINNESFSQRVNPSQKEGFSRAKELFDLLTEEQKEGLYQLYKFDFDMLGYSHTEYM